MNEPNPAPSLRAKDAAQLLGASEPTFWRWTRQPGFPKARRLSSRCTVFDRAELLAWRDSKAVDRVPS